MSQSTHPTVDALLKARIIWIEDNEVWAEDEDDVLCILWDPDDLDGLEQELHRDYAPILLERLKETRHE